jgi:putative transposase
LEVLQLVVTVLNEFPFYGYRKVALELRDTHARDETPKQVRRIMRRAGLKAIWQGPKTTVPNPEHPKYPYLLRNKAIWLPNQVWATDITYIRLRGGHVYLVAILDLHSRKVLSWKLSNTLDAGFCVAALEEAIARWGVPAIFNTDQGSQFTSEAFTGVLHRHGIRISMDGVKRAIDNIYVERLWRTLKYEEIYLKDYQSMAELKTGLDRYFRFYNGRRYHQSLGYATPNEIYEARFQNVKFQEAAA